MLRCFTMLLLTVVSLAAQTNDDLKAQVRRTETAFARTLAYRDLAAFQKFLAKDAIFMSNVQATRGPAAVVERWKRFFDGARAPFSWEPEFVEVTESGTLAMSSGPVRDPAGK